LTRPFWKFSEASFSISVDSLIGTSSSSSTVIKSMCKIKKENKGGKDEKEG
jgi:hypothetical protein